MASPLPSLPVIVVSGNAGPGLPCQWHRDNTPDLAARSEEASQVGTEPGKCLQPKVAALVRHTAGTERASCLPRKFSLDDLLTIVMIYWTTGTITSSQRFYKENMGSRFLSDKHHR